MSTPDPTIHPSTYYVELSPTEHGPALVASSPNLIIGVPEPIDGQIAGWVVNVPPVAGGWEIAEGAVAAHLYALTRGEAGDPNVTQVHPAPESGREPARVVDGLTVGARYAIGEKNGSLIRHCQFVEKDASGSYVFLDDETFGGGRIHAHEKAVALGNVLINDADGNRVDYWAEQARAFIDAARAQGVTDPRRHPLLLPAGGYSGPLAFAVSRVLGWQAEALPTVPDEQESTR